MGVVGGVIGGAAVGAGGSANGKKSDDARLRLRGLELLES